MKLFNSALIVIGFSFSAWAQDPNSTSTTSAAATNASVIKSKGVTVGLLFSSLEGHSSKQTAELRSKSTGETLPVKAGRINPGYANMYGINFGYKDKYALNSSFGYSTALSIFRIFNGEGTPAVFNLYKAQGDLVFSFTDSVSFLGGLNMSYIPDTESFGVKYEPSMGIQAGLNMDFGSMGVMIGYQTLEYKGKYSGASIPGYTLETEVEGYNSGAIAQVSYTF